MNPIRSNHWAKLFEYRNKLLYTLSKVHKTGSLDMMIEPTIRAISSPSRTGKTNGIGPEWFKP